MRYRLTGASFSRRESGKRMTYKKGDIVQGPVPPALADCFEALDPPEENVPDPPAKSLTLKHRAGPWWDVVNAEGERINDKALTKEDAEEMAR